MNDEYISRQEVMEAVKHAWGKGLDPTQYIRLIPAAKMRKEIKGVPILGYRPQRTERYEAYGINENGETLFRKIIWTDEKVWAEYCPFCGKRLCSRFVNFCPNCGADMRGE